MMDFNKGAQVTICYGKRSHADLLIHNGFASLNDAQPFNDGVTISLGEYFL